MADFKKKNPLKDGAKEDPARVAARAAHVEKFIYDKLKGNTAIFIKLFGGAAGEVQTDFYATADQALYFANGGTVRPAQGRVRQFRKVENGGFGAGAGGKERVFRPLVGFHGVVRFISESKGEGREFRGMRRRYQVAVITAGPAFSSGLRVADEVPTRWEGDRLRFLATGSRSSCQEKI